MNGHKQPRFFQEANAPFILPGGFAPTGVIWGLILFVLGFGLGSGPCMTAGVVVGLVLAKKVGKDEHFVKSLLQHLITYRGMRYISAASTTPSPKVLVRTKDGRMTPISQWVEAKKEAEDEKRQRR